MKHLFPTLFTTLLPSYFHCETCIMEKINHDNFPLSMNKSFVPFALVHFNLLGLTLVPSNSFHHWFVIFIDDTVQG